MKIGRARQLAFATALISVVLAGCDATPRPSGQSPASPTASPAPSAEQQKTPVPAVSTATIATLDPGPTQPELDSVAFAADATHGWVGGAGVILGTSDGGASWDPQWTGDRTIIEIRALTSSNVWAIGIKLDAGGRATAATILRTSDAGAHWSSWPINPRISALDVVSSTTAWAISSIDDTGTCGAACITGGQLLRTTDGGRTWRVRSIGPGNARATCFSNPNRGYAAVGDSIYATSNGGVTWQRRAGLPTGEGQGVAWMSCPASSLWLLVNLDGGAGGHINYAAYRSIDGGRKLTKVLGNAFYGIPAGLATADAEPGPLVAPDAATAIELGVSPAAEEVSLTITHDLGRIWITRPLQDIVSQGGAIAFPNRSRGWIATNTWGRGKILATRDGGLTWREQYPAPSPHPIADISFVSPTLGFGIGIAGDSSAFLKTQDAGGSWTLMADLPEAAGFIAGPAFGGAKQLSFSDASHGWVATASGHVLATVDGGRSWARVAGVPAAAVVGGVGLGSDSVGCITISDQASPTTTELRTSDSGRTWSPVEPFEQLDACARGAPGIAVARAADGALGAPFKPFLAFAGDRAAWAFLGTGFARTIDRGATWQRVDWPSATIESAAPISSSVASFGDPSNGWILTSDGSIYRTADGGLAWARLP
jgi:photosystem II stability/assembly factor-like uncharacterized protein